jgi:Ca2+-binding EF-hand superfamily protein
MFHAIDRNEDGVLSWDDHQLILDRFAAATHLSADSAEYQALRGAIARNWEELKVHADLDRDDVVDLEEWLAHNDRMLGTKEGYEIAISSISNMLLGLADDDRDGKLTLANWTMLLGVYGADAQRAQQSFARVDLDGDGIVTVSELMQAVEQFVGSSNPDDPGHWLLGPPA